METDRKASYSHVKALEKEIELLKEQVKEMKTSNKEEIGKINNRISDLEAKHGELKLMTTELRQDIRYMNKTLETLVQEVKGIGSEIIRINAVEDKEEQTQNNLLQTILGNSNRVTLIVVLTVCSSLLFVLGMKMKDILKIFTM